MVTICTNGQPRQPMHPFKILKGKILYAAVCTLTLTACGPPEPVSHESMVWINHYYIQNPVATLNASAGGWLFRGAKEVGREIRIGFLIPGPMTPDKDKRRAVLNTICPARTEPIWQSLRRDNKLIIDVWTDDKKFKDFTVC